MVFEFDQNKSDRNLWARGFDFTFAATVFDGRTIESNDERTDYGEVRTKATGAVGTLMLTVIYTDRGAVRRIISARLANRKERASWHSSE